MTAARALLGHRAAALLRRDRAGWLAGIDGRAAALRARQAAAFAALARVPLTGWRYDVDQGPGYGVPPGWAARYGGPVWMPRVTLWYGLSGVDTELTGRPQVLVFVRRSERWLLAADDQRADDGTVTWRGMWDFGPMVTGRGQHSLVLAHPDHAGLLAAFVSAADAAVPRVAAVWGGGWNRRVALLLPDSQAELAASVGPQFATASIAAVAIADWVDVARSRVRGQRVVVNPGELSRLGPLARHVLLQHEITHLASRTATGDGMPTWLVEGLADYVAYSDTGLPADQIAPDLRAAVRSGHWSGQLPSDTGFAADSPTLARAYEEGWTACRLIVKLAGQAGLVRLYRLVGTAPDAATALDSALRRVLGEPSAAFVNQWRAAVRAELS